jgi:hypothetical protein
MNIKLVRAKLVAAREELIIRQRELRAAQRNYNRVIETLTDLEAQIETYLAGLKRGPENAGRTEGAGDAQLRASE